jgi:hypothetical protein
MWLRQMAQLSTTISQAQRATAFHYAMLALPRDVFLRLLPTFLTSKRFLSPSALAPALTAFVFAGGASAMSMSAMFVGCGWVSGVCGEAVDAVNGTERRASAAFSCTGRSERRGAASGRLWGVAV